MKLYKKIVASTFAVLLCILAPLSVSQAAKYTIDTSGAHAFIQFRVQHLGYSWLYGRFNEFSGHFTYDSGAPGKSTVELNINTKSVDSNHAERDKHIRSADFLDVNKYPTARFESTKVTFKEKNHAVVEGNLTLRGITKPIRIEVEKIGEGKDPWGGYRAGFEGRTSFLKKDFGIDFNLGPKSETIEMILSLEGIRQ